MAVLRIILQPAENKCTSPVYFTTGACRSLFYSSSDWRIVPKLAAQTYGGRERGPASVDSLGILEVFSCTPGMYAVFRAARLTLLNGRVFA